MSTEEKNETVGAEVAPVKKYKMSEIIEALKTHNIESDCGGFLLGVDDDGAHSLLDLDQMDIHRAHDFRKVIVHEGLSQLVSEAMRAEPEALAAFAAAGGRAASSAATREMMTDLLGAIAGRNNN